MTRLPPCPKNVRTGSIPYPLSVRTHHKIRKIGCFLHQKVRTSTFEELLPPLSEKSPQWTNPPTLIADVLYESLTADVLLLAIIK